MAFTALSCFVQALGCKMVVPQRWYDTLGLLGNPDLLASNVFTTSPSAVCPLLLALDDIVAVVAMDCAMRWGVTMAGCCCWFRPVLGRLRLVHQHLVDSPHPLPLLCCCASLCAPLSLVAAEPHPCGTEEQVTPRTPAEAQHHRHLSVGLAQRPRGPPPVLQRALLPTLGLQRAAGSIRNCKHAVLGTVPCPVLNFAVRFRSLTPCVVLSSSLYA